MKYVTNISDILRAVSKRYGIPEDVIISELHSKPVNHARHIAMYLAVNLTWLSKSDIATRFNRSDHSGIYYGYRKIAWLMAKDEGVRSQVTDLIKGLESQ